MLYSAIFHFHDIDTHYRGVNPLLQLGSGEIFELGWLE